MAWPVLILSTAPLCKTKTLKSGLVSCHSLHHVFRGILSAKNQVCPKWNMVFWKHMIAGWRSWQNITIHEMHFPPEISHAVGYGLCSGHKAQRQQAWEIRTTTPPCPPWIRKTTHTHFFKRLISVTFELLESMLVSRGASCAPHPYPNTFATCWFD